MMELLGLQIPATLNTARERREFSSRWISNMQLGYYLVVIYWHHLYTAATEEFTGAGAPTTVTITAS
jgi:1,2-phenylacetyl-CoA epoxidase catalytic subunit